MADIVIHIADEFSDAPGARYKTDGDSSGEEFYSSLLKPRFEKALQSNSKLFIDLDGTYGYATSFISEAFGTLSKDFGVEIVLTNLKFKSDEDLKLVSYIKKIINNPNAT
ncbi:STAS-like domain-containing protein [Methylophaga sp.]|jgi:hypothetical protein|uniref:STAS-like domain-containing protein n=1 Tax=Methylophaga sp. TaxID=2024840 RepID=UPI003F708BCE